MAITYSRELILTLPNREIINIAKYSPDGKYLALVADKQYINIMNVPAYTLKQRIDCTQYTKINDIDFATHSTIIGAAADNVLALYGNPGGKLFKAITPEGLGIHHFKILQFARDNVLIGTATNHNIYIYYDYAIPELKVLNFCPHGGEITSINFISHALIITSYADGVCLKWNSTVDTREEQEFFQILRHNITGVKISHSTLSPDNKYVLLTHLCSKITSWEIDDTVENTRSGRRAITFVNEYVGHTATEKGEFEIKAKFMFDPNNSLNKFVIAGSEDQLIYIWEFRTGQVKATLTCHESIPVNIVPNLAAYFEQFDSLQKEGNLFLWKRTITT